MHELVGMRVMHRVTKRKGYIICVGDGKMKVSYVDSEGTYSFPACLVNIFLLEDEELQKKYISAGEYASFELFRNTYRHALDTEISYLKETGGKRYKIIDGEKLQTDKDTYVYSFETDSELHFPDGTTIKLWFPDKIMPAQVIACEEFNIIIQTIEFIGDEIESVEFTAEPWQLMEALAERIDAIDAATASIAYELACNGKCETNNYIL